MLDRLLVERIACQQAIVPLEGGFRILVCAVDVRKPQADLPPGPLHAIPDRRCPVLIAMLGQRLPSIQGCRLFQGGRVIALGEFAEAVEIHLPAIGRIERNPSPLGQHR